MNWATSFFGLTYRRFQHFSSFISWSEPIKCQEIQQAVQTSQSAQSPCDNALKKQSCLLMVVRRRTLLASCCSECCFVFLFCFVSKNSSDRQIGRGCILAVLEIFFHPVISKQDSMQSYYICKSHEKIEDQDKRIWTIVKLRLSNHSNKMQSE